MCTLSICHHRPQKVPALVAQAELQAAGCRPPDQTSVFLTCHLWLGSACLLFYAYFSPFWGGDFVVFLESGTATMDQYLEAGKKAAPPPNLNGFI